MAFEVTALPTASGQRVGTQQGQVKQYLASGGDGKN
jgi:hypothetical protein